MNQQPKNVDFSSPSPQPSGHMNLQLTNDASSSPSKPTENTALVVTPDKKSPIDVDDEDDSDAFSSISLNGGKDEGENAGDDGIDVGVPNNEPSIMPRPCSNSTEEVATAGVGLTSNSLIDDGTRNNVTGDEVMEGENSEVILINKDGSVSKSTNKEIEEIQKKILNLQYLIETSTGDTTGTPPEDVLSGGALNVAHAQVLRLQRSLEEKKTTSSDVRPDPCPTDPQDAIVINENTSDGTDKTFSVSKSTLGSHEIGGKDTIDALAKQVLISNTTSNAVSSIRVSTLDNTVTPVWKYSQHHHRHPSVAAIATQIWKKIKSLKTVRYIERLPITIKFTDVWSKFNTDPYSPDTPVTRILEFISTIEKKKEEWTKSPGARFLFIKTLCATSPEVFGADWKRAGKLHPSQAASLWTAAIQALGCSFKLYVHIKLTTKGILKSDMKDFKAGGKSLTFDVASVSVKTKAGWFLTGRVPRQLFA